MKTIITIGRQFGSGGKEIGEKLAKHFGIKCYCKIIHSFCQRNCLKIHVIIDELRDGYKPAALTTLTPYQQKARL